jgi:beta-galactosidase
MNRDQVDAAYLHADGLIVGADGLDDEGQPRPLQGWSAMTLVGLDGRTHEHKPKRSRKPHAPKLESWQHAELDTMLDGSDASYGDIDGPTSLEHLGQDFGYGWYDVPLNKAGKGDTWCPRGEDRLTLYHEAKPLGVLGNGPGAEDGPTPVKLPGSGRLIVLADNLGRFNYGQRVGTDLKGMVDPLYSVTPVKLGKPEIADGPPADPFAVSELVYHQRKGDLPLGRSFTWSVKPASRRAMVLQIDAMDFPAVVLINGEPAGFFNRVFSGHRLRMVLEPTQGGFTTGTNELTLSLLGQPDDGFDIASHVSLWQTTGTHTGHKGWRFAKWTEPSDGAFVDAPARSTGLPCWWRCGFSASPDADTPLFWEPKGLSKGQVYLNGRNLGRYFVATPDGKTVGPQKRWYLPEPWLNADGNTLMIFDEAGKHPGKSVLVYDTKGTHG